MTKVIAWALALCATLAFPADAEDFFAGRWDGVEYDGCVDVGAVHVRAGHWIDGISLTCRDDGDRRETRIRGGEGGRLYIFELRPEERIVGFTIGYGGPSGPYVYTIRIHTDWPRDSRVFGGDGGHYGDDQYDLFMPPNNIFSGLLTTSSRYLEGVGFETREMSESGINPPLALPAPSLR